MLNIDKLLGSKAAVGEQQFTEGNRIDFAFVNETPLAPQSGTFYFYINNIVTDARYISFTPGGPQTLIVPIQTPDDLIFRSTQPFSFNFVADPGTTLDIAAGSGLLLDNDPTTVSLTVPQPSLFENATNRTFKIDVTRAGTDLSMATDVTVAFTPSGQAPADQADFVTSLASQVVRFAPGETAKSVSLEIRPDSGFEANETLTAFIASASSTSPNGTFAGTAANPIAQGSATLRILNDDPNPFGTVDVYRFFETRTGTHFYTPSVVERDTVQATLPHYRLEGVGFQAVPNQPGADPVYRFFKPETGTHFYTPSVAERDSVLKNLPNYIYEEIGFYASDQDGVGLTEVYRFLKPADGTHFYTSSEVEKASVQANLPNYTYEGVSFYVPDSVNYTLFG